MTQTSNSIPGSQSLKKVNGHQNGVANGNGVTNSSSPKLNRAEETDDLLTAVRELVIPFIKAADDAATQKHTGEAYVAPNGELQPVLVDYQSPVDLVKRLQIPLPEQGLGKEGLLESIQKILQYSVNTWDQGFLDKLFASNTPVGVVSDMILSVLNTNVHVYQVSPVLTLIEKVTSKKLANLFGFTGPNAGGINCQGGSSSNLTSLVVARNTLYPECRTAGNASHNFVVFTSAHGHYSVEKSAMICGLGSDSVWPVPVDSEGCLKPDLLEDSVLRAKAEGKTPFYVNATAGTTVRGAYEDLEAISAICKRHNLWLHVDASFGGPVIFSKKHSWRLKGSHLADSLTVNPHKMMNVPATCSYLLGPDMNLFNKANSTKAGYLFHSNSDGEIWDQADFTLQCGRRGDSLKVALAWQYYGSDSFERQTDHAYDVVEHLYNLVRDSPNLELLYPNLPSCLQICFYYAPGGKLSEDPEANTKITADIVHKLIPRGFMVDYAPGEKGSFFRVVINWQTLFTTVEGLVKAIEILGSEISL
uniref:Glutamate decarboxylase n=1 Tax=Bionectria ochroleuca TaxID=29856 RepID=A0A8H7NJ65_BIOOC